MAFGITATGVISRQTNHSVQVAEQIAEDGTIEDMTTHGGRKEVTEETYTDAASHTNTALNGQSGTSDIVTADNLIESNTDYCRRQTTKVDALAAPLA